MSCLHPLKGFEIGITKNGKKRLKIRPYNVDHIEDVGNNQFIDRFDNSSPSLGKRYSNYEVIPCGRCIECRLQRSKAWADRAVLELQDYDSNLFITLTYNDDNLPHNKTYDDSGNIIMMPTLVKEDLQKFWKRLRKYTDEQGRKIRYLACGEYGSFENTHRPHYHAIVFNLKLPDLVPFSKSPLGDIYYTSETLSKIWSKGFVIIGEATHQSIAYVSRYVVKKAYGKDAEIYSKLNIVPEFLTMSRKPGIGYNYYQEHKKELFNETKYFFPLRDGVGSAVTGRYFNNLFESDFDSGSVELRKQKIKDLREVHNDLILENTDLEYLDYLENLEYSKEKKLQYIKERNGIQFL